MAVKKIATFDEWIDAFRVWQKDIGLRLPKHADYQFEAKYGDLKTEEIEFGDFRGERKWERVTQIPHQPIRLRHGQRLPHHDRGDAPRLADVPPARQPLRGNG
jgi:hypothetical protein